MVCKLQAFQRFLQYLNHFVCSDVSQLYYPLFLAMPWYFHVGLALLTFSFILGYSLRILACAATFDTFCWRNLMSDRAAASQFPVDSPCFLMCLSCFPYVFHVMYVFALRIILKNIIKRFEKGTPKTSKREPKTSHKMTRKCDQKVNQKVIKKAHQKVVKKVPKIQLKK